MIIYLAGREANVIESAEHKIVSSEDNLFPKDLAYDRFPGSSFKFAAVSETGATYDINLNRLLNGGFENWGVSNVPDDWIDDSDGTGALSAELTEVIEGSKALKLVGAGSGNEARAYRDNYVVSGWKCTIDGRIRGDGSNNTIVRIFCYETGQWLDSSGSWQNTVQDFISRSTATYSASNPVTFMVPGISTVLRHLLRIKVEIFIVTGTGYADAFRLWPWVDFASVHGHALPIGGPLSFKLQHDTTAAFPSPTTIAMTIARPTFWKSFTEVGERYWRFKADGLNPLQGKYGELVLGQYGTLSPDFLPGSEMRFRYPRTREEAENTQIRVINLSNDPIREYMLEFYAITEAQKEAFRQEIVIRSELGKDPLIIVPDNNSEDVIYGKMIDEYWGYNRQAFGSEPKGSYVYTIRIREDPLDLEIQ